MAYTQSQRSKITPVAVRNVQINRDRFLTLAGALPAYLLQVLIYLASDMGTTRTCTTGSKALARGLGISRESARDKLRDLSRVQLNNGNRLITVTMERPTPDKPAHYLVYFSSGVPVACVGEPAEEGMWLEHRTTAPSLAAGLSPCAYVTLLAIAVHMREERTVHMPIGTLAAMMFETSEVATGEYITELLNKNMITRVGDPGKDVYHVEDHVPLCYGGT